MASISNILLAAEHSLRHSDLLAQIYSFVNGFHPQIHGPNNRLLRNNSILRRCELSVEGSGCEITLGKRARLWNSSISVVGKNCRLSIGDNCALRGVRLVVEDTGSALLIGAGTSMTKATVVAQEGCRIRIGEDCMISQEAVLRNSDGHSVINTGTGQRVNRAGDIQVERHVWIGALVLSGSHLKEGCIVGAGTLVKETTISAACVVVGRPARIVRRSVRWERDRQEGKP